MEPLSELPFTKGEFGFLLPIAVPALFGLVLLVMDLFLPKNGDKTPLALTSVLGAVLTGFAAVAAWSSGTEQLVLGGSLAVSRYGAALGLGISLSAMVMSLAHVHHGRLAGGPGRLSLASGEFYALVHFAVCGMMALVVANDLVTFFVAIEILSIAVYCLTGLDRRRARSAEGAMKYFVLGAFSSGFLLYGMSLLYGATHQIQLSEIAALDLTGGQATLARAGGLLFLVGLLFKVGAVPFHAWSPDAYEGAPTSVTGFMSVGVKVAAFGGALRLVETLGDCGALGQAGAWLLWIVAAMTVIVGNAGALTQTNPRRLLAYSSVAHTGYVLIGLVAVARYVGLGDENLQDAARDATAGVIYYMLAYGAANLGAFAVLAHLERGGEEIDDIGDLSGLARTQPGVALAMTISLISLAGIPGTAGFVGKLWVFRAGVWTGEIGLVVLALLMSVMSLYYYLRFVIVMYMREPAVHPEVAASGHSPLEPDPRRWGSQLALGGAAILTLVLGLYPSRYLLELIVQGSEALL